MRRRSADRLRRLRRCGQRGHQLAPPGRATASGTDRLSLAEDGVAGRSGEDGRPTRRRRRRMLLVRTGGVPDGHAHRPRASTPSPVSLPERFYHHVIGLDVICSCEGPARPSCLSGAPSSSCRSNAIWHSAGAGLRDEYAALSWFAFELPMPNAVEMVAAEGLGRPVRRRSNRDCIVTAIRGATKIASSARSLNRLNRMFSAARPPAAPAPRSRGRGRSRRPAAWCPLIARVLR